MPSSSDALVVTSGPLSGQTLPLEHRELVIGRDAACDVPLTSYTRLSRRHARLIPISGGWKIEDLGSTNGILLDGARVQEGILKHGSRIQLGDFEALVRAYVAPPAQHPQPPVTQPPAPRPKQPLIPPPVPGVDSPSPAVAPSVRKNPKWLWPALGLSLVLVSAGLFLGGRSLRSGDAETDAATDAKVRRALDTGDAEDNGNTKPDTAPEVGTDTETRPTVAAPISQPAPAINGRIAPATVALAKSATVLIMRPENGKMAFGSGFVVGNGRQVITNRHVVAEEDTDNIGNCVLIFDAGTGSERKVRVPASSITLANGPDTFSADLALLTLPDDANAPAALPIGNSEDLNETDTTWVFGFPLGVGTLTLDQELPSVSVKDASVERVQRGKVDGTEAAKVIQLGSTVTHGNSGGPVLNANGEVVGVISRGSEGTGISYAIPSVWVKRLLP